MSIDYDREYILDHYSHPRNYGTLEQPHAHAEVVNPLCGDRLTMDMHILDGRIAAVRFQGKGCAISQASASILTELIEGKTLQEVVSLDQDGFLHALSIPISSARAKCAFLSLRVMRDCLSQMGYQFSDDDDLGRMP
jgi:nitrogen fixation protein NifU and related proteins